MEIIRWFYEHGGAVLQNAGIIGSLVFTGVSLRSEARARRISNLIAFTQQHRDIWQIFYQRPELARVFDPTANIAAAPPTDGDRVLVRLLILHLGTVYRAIQFDEMLRPEGMERDIHDFFALPIPAAIWKDLRELQDKDFVRFIERL